MKSLLLIVAMLLVASAAHAEQWYYVNLGTGQAAAKPACIALPGGQNPVASMTATLGAQGIHTDMDMTDADGSRFMILDHQGSNYAFATTVKRCIAVRQQIRQQIARASAGEDRWYVAQYRGDCVELSATFSGVHTPTELHKAMTRKGANLLLERRGPDVALLIDGSGHYPPMVMVHGLARCEANSAALIAAQ